jgi:pimeloyl-ACP methyl ester carboxylesterase
MDNRFNVIIRNKIGLTILLTCTILINCKYENPNTTPKIELPPSYEARYYQGMRYGLFIPPAYDSTKSYPLITRLHGSTDTVSWDLSWYHDPIQATDPCFVLTPKSLVKNDGWGTSWKSKHSPDMIKTLEIIQLIRKEFNIDSTRLYLHGTSMGGFGVFSVLDKEPGMFAGAFSICGGGNPATAANVLKTPLWIFHGSADDVVPVRFSRNMYQAIINAGGHEARYTEYPGIKHNAWDSAWKEPALMFWLLAQRKGISHGAPDPPETFSCQILDQNQRLLKWAPPSNTHNPNNQIWYYCLYRDNQLLTEVDNTHTSFMDSTRISPAYHLSAVNYFFKESVRIIPISIQTP